MKYDENNSIRYKIFLHKRIMEKIQRRKIKLNYRDDIQINRNQPDINNKIKNDPILALISHNNSTLTINFVRKDCNMQTPIDSNKCRNLYRLRKSSTINKNPIQKLNSERRLDRNFCSFVKME